MFKILTIQEKISDKEMQCDAVDGFFGYMRSADFETKKRLIHDLFKVRKMRIEPNEEHIYIQAFDDETGEMYEMNCKKGVHKFCIEKNIYPPKLIELLKEKTQ